MVPSDILVSISSNVKQSASVKLADFYSDLTLTYVQEIQSFSPIITAKVRIYVPLLHAHSKAKRNGFTIKLTSRSSSKFIFINSDITRWTFNFNSLPGIFIKSFSIYFYCGKHRRGLLNRSCECIETLQEFHFLKSLGQLFLFQQLHLIASSVVVENPNVTSPSYVFPASVMYSATFVALPIQMGNTPVTSGSNVPVCPIFSFLKSYVI